ncbi:nuclear transport factor 2 family protein [Sulfitobacter sp. JB4-11]|uniref:nuclear transport factor 2 family protein n=1 Tax=Sulfitobacter rhodophyticola TaxID=3238304 RepID=UPI003517C63D
MAEHPNIVLLNKLNLRDLDASADLFADDFVWHYFNRKLPDIEGDYVGIEGLKEFFTLIGGRTKGSFNVEPMSATPVGDELIVVHVRDTMEIDARPIAIDVVVVWRVAEGRFVEAWDIPSVFTNLAV